MTEEKLSCSGPAGANRLAIAGLVLLTPGMIGMVFAITDVLFGSLVASVVTVAFFLRMWFVLPI